MSFHFKHIVLLSATALTFAVAPVAAQAADAMSSTSMSATAPAAAVPSATATMAAPDTTAAPAAITTSTASAPVMVGGAEMFATKNIVENASQSKDHTTLVAAVKAAGLDTTLATPGPFTVFAPTNEAFAKLPAGTVDALLKPEAKQKLTQVLTYHVVPGHLTAADLEKQATAAGGKATLKTVEGDSLTVEKDASGKWWVMDSNGGKAEITQADVMQSNGVIFVIDSVLMPKN